MSPDVFFECTCIPQKKLVDSNRLIGKAFFFPPIPYRPFRNPEFSGNLNRIHVIYQEHCSNLHKQFIRHLHFGHLAFPRAFRGFGRAALPTRQDLHAEALRGLSQADREPPKKSAHQPVAIVGHPLLICCTDQQKIKRQRIAGSFPDVTFAQQAMIYPAEPIRHPSEPMRHQWYLFNHLLLLVKIVKIVSRACPALDLIYTASKTISILCEA